MQEKIYTLVGIEFQAEDVRPIRGIIAREGAHPRENLSRIMKDGFAIMGTLMEGSDWARGRHKARFGDGEEGNILFAGRRFALSHAADSDAGTRLFRAVR